MQVSIQKPIHSIFNFLSLSFKFQKSYLNSKWHSKIPVYKVESNFQVQYSLNFGLYKCYMSHRIHNVNLNLWYYKISRFLIQEFLDYKFWVLTSCYKCYILILFSIEVSLFFGFYVSCSIFEPCFLDQPSFTTFPSLCHGSCS